MNGYEFNCLKDFKCKADNCKHTCCAGWEILIDKKSISKYKKISEKDKRFSDNIDYKSLQMKRDKVNNCLFLKNGLCQIITDYGEKSLCQVCKDHPRFRSFFSGRTELGLGLSCEEAVRVVLGCKKLEMTPVKIDKNAKGLKPFEKKCIEKREEILSVIYSEKPLQEVVKGILNAVGIKSGYISVSKFDFASLEYIDGNFVNGIDINSAEPDYNNLKNIEKELRNFLAYLTYRHVSKGYNETEIKERVAFIILMFKLCVNMLGNKAEIERLFEIVRDISSEIEYSEENVINLLEQIEDLIPLYGETV